MPERDRFTAPRFEHYAPPALDHDGARVLLFLGALAGHSAPVRTHSPLVGAEITLHAGHMLRLDVDRAFEHGVLVDTGQVDVGGVIADRGRLVYLPVGADTLGLRAGDESEARVLLLGGRPLGERIVMWWNFIGRDHDEIAAYREQWNRRRAGDAHAETGPFGTFPTQWRETLPAPVLPAARLRPRG